MAVVKRGLDTLHLVSVFSPGEGIYVGVSWRQPVTWTPLLLTRMRFEGPHMLSAWQDISKCLASLSKDHLPDNSCIHQERLVECGQELFKGKREPRTFVFPWALHITPNPVRPPPYFPPSLPSCSSPAHLWPDNGIQVSAPVVILSCLCCLKSDAVCLCTKLRWAVHPPAASSLRSCLRGHIAGILGAHLLLQHL